MLSPEIVALEEAGIKKELEQASVDLQELLHSFHNQGITLHEIVSYDISRGITFELSSKSKLTGKIWMIRYLDNLGKY